MWKKYQLKNGLKVLLVESHKSPVLSIQMWVKTGSADERKGEEGISHFIEHLVFKGSEKFGVGEIAATVEGAGGELNAYTSFDQTVFYVTISKQFQSVGLDVISQMMGFPKFDQAEIDNEREVVIEEIKRSNDSPHRQASRLLFSTVYPKHPYGIPVIGYPELIRSVSRETLLKYYRARYTPKNMTLVVTGDFQTAAMKKDVERYFGAFKPTPLRKVRRPLHRPQARPQVVAQKTNFQETIFHLTFPAPKASHKDIVALEIFALILGQGESSRLSQRLRLTEHLVNYAGSSVFTARDPGFFALSMSLPDKDLAQAMDSLKDEFIKALSSPPSEAEFRKALTNLTSEQFYSQETVDGLARSFGHYQDLFNDPGHMQKFVRQAQALTPEKVLQIARKYLLSAKLSLILMSPTEPDEKALRSWLNSFIKDMKRSRVAKLKSKKLKLKKLSFLTNGKAENKVQRFELANGAVLIARPNFETPVLSVRCASLGGSRLESPETQGATELLSRVWTSGCGPYNEHELNARVDEMAASLSAFGGRNTVGLSMTCLKPFTQEMLELLTCAITEPHFEGVAISREVKSMLEYVKLRKDNPAQLCILQFMKSLFGDHPYGSDPYGDEAVIRRLGQTQVREIYRQSQGLTFVASGAFEPVELKARLEDLLAKRRYVGAQPKSIEVRFPAKDAHVFQKSEKEQSHVLVGFPGVSLHDRDRYALQVMQAVLAGQGGRLFLELRDKASLAYSVSPMRMEGLEAGYFGAYIGCSPEKVQKAIRMLMDEFTKLYETTIPVAELDRAKRYLIGKHDIELQKNSNISSSILFDVVYGIDHLETYRYAERIRDVSAESVLSLAKRLFVQPKVISVVGPQQPW